MNEQINICVKLLKKDKGRHAVALKQGKGGADSWDNVWCADILQVSFKLESQAYHVQKSWKMNAWIP